MKRLVPYLALLLALLLGCSDSGAVVRRASNSSGTTQLGTGAKAQSIQLLANGQQPPANGILLTSEDLVQLTGQVTMASGSTNDNIVFLTTNAIVIDVNEQGYLIGKEPGEANIIVASGDDTTVNKIVRVVVQAATRFELIIDIATRARGESDRPAPTTLVKGIPLAQASPSAGTVPGLNFTDFSTGPPKTDATPSASTGGSFSTGTGGASAQFPGQSLTTCCLICTTGTKACGNTCIDANQTCDAPAGCSCNG